MMGLALVGCLLEHEARAMLVGHSTGSGGEHGTGMNAGFFMDEVHYLHIEEAL